MGTAALPFEILCNGLTPCYYLMLLCCERGEIRCATADIPTGRFYPCPLCVRNCAYKLLGEGGTHRLIAVLGEIRESVSLRQITIARADGPARLVDLHHPAHGHAHVKSRPPAFPRKAAGQLLEQRTL